MTEPCPAWCTEKAWEIIQKNQVKLETAEKKAKAHQKKYGTIKNKPLKIKKPWKIFTGVLGNPAISSASAVYASGSDAEMLGFIKAVDDKHDASGVVGIKLPGNKSKTATEIKIELEAQKYMQLKQTIDQHAKDIGKKLYVPSLFSGLGFETMQAEQVELKKKLLEKKLLEKEYLSALKQQKEAVAKQWAAFSGSKWGLWMFKPWQKSKLVYVSLLMCRRVNFRMLLVLFGSWVNIASAKALNTKAKALGYAKLTNITA